jgi:uncharacterized protein (DUF1778 family)
MKEEKKQNLKTAEIHFRVSEASKAKMTKKASLAGLSLTEFIIRSTERVGVEKLVAKENSFKVAMEVGKELNKIGNNINQIAHYVNREKSVHEGVLKSFFAETQKILDNQERLMSLVKEL